MSIPGTQDQINAVVARCFHDLDINCAKTTLLALSGLFGFPLNDQVIQAATAMNGAGRFRGQCGLVEGTLMFMGVFFAATGECDETVVRMAKKFAKAFQKEFGSISCHELRPEGFKPEHPKNFCEPLTQKSVRLSYDFIQNELSGRGGFELQPLADVLS